MAKEKPSSKTSLKKNNLMTIRIDELRSKADSFIQEHLKSLSLGRLPGLKELGESMAYSANLGGKRIRPLLSILTAKALGEPAEKVHPFATAVELIHTYSLIHDDLPAMDNDDFRRGKPTNHRVFGQAIAILAGDALQAEAFRVLARGYSSEPELALKLIEELVQAAGATGMVGGQAMDTQSRGAHWSLAQVELLHIMKTGALLKASVIGAARACKASADQLEALNTYGEAVGLAFQIADDILDYSEQDVKTDGACYPAVIGIRASREECLAFVARAVDALKTFDGKADELRELAEFIYKRTLEAEPRVEAQLENL